MAEDQQHPLRAALPPNNDYLDYLTAIEDHITKENLPVLHEVLQDTKLTTNIGWDLVHPLLPLLPEAEQCMQDIAKLGNPREVILKVTEALRILSFDELDTSDDDDEPRTDAASAARDAPQLPLPVIQFQMLLSMLSVLHPRVKAKYPSRFLSTSLQAILASYTNARSHFGDLTGSVITFMKTLSGTKRPHLPPRQSSSFVPTAPKSGIAEDPEGQSEPPAVEETVMVKRLLQAFLTHILEEYMLHLSHYDDVPGLAWCSRVQEKFHPEMTVPQKSSYTDKFAKEEQLRNRILVVSQVVALGQELGLDSNELYSTIIEPSVEPTGVPSSGDDPPTSAAEIPFSKAGSLYLFTARTVAKKLYDDASGDSGISIFPQHDAIMRNFLSSDSPAAIGTESEALIDAVTVLGLIALDDNDFGEPDDDEQFTEYLQVASLLSANTPSPTLRYHAHLLTSTVLRSYPEDFVRLTFIRDTLEHCPYENLKASAVGWLKGEIIEANTAALVTSTVADLGISEHGHGASSPQTSADDDSQSIFSTPIALNTVSPFLFPDLTHDLKTASLADSYDKFRLELSFYLAALNFYYLLLSAKPLHAILNVSSLHQEGDIGGRFIGPLREATKRFREGLTGGGLSVEEGGDTARALGELGLVDDILDRVEWGVAHLN